MSIDFSNEPIGKPRWCITRGGEIVQAWRRVTDAKHTKIVVVACGGGGGCRTVAGECVEGEMYPGDLVSFAPPECDSFTWTPPSPIKVGDWVEVVHAITDACPQGSKWQVSDLSDDGDPIINTRLHLPGRLRKCDPPSATYRAFANAEEFKPHASRFVRLAKGVNSDICYAIVSFTNNIAALGCDPVAKYYSELLSHYVFADTGEPCGVKVDE